MQLCWKFLLIVAGHSSSRAPQHSVIKLWLAVARGALDHVLCGALVASMWLSVFVELLREEPNSRLTS